MSGPVDPAEVQKRFDRLTEILGDIVTRADAQAAERCPYRDRHDTCTARFRCRNQAPPDRNQAPAAEDAPAAEATLVCTHDGAFDYRSAWESDPRAVDIARARLARNARRTSPSTPEGPGADTDAPAPQD